MPENTAPLSYTDTSAITAEVSHRVQEIQESSSKWNISDRTNLSQPWPYKGIKWIPKEKTKLGTTREEILDTLARHGIIDEDTLREKGTRWFDMTFGRYDLSVFFERRVSSINLTELRQLAERLEWEIVAPWKSILGTTREHIIASLASHGINNAEDLSRTRITWFSRTYGRIDIGVFLGKKITAISSDILSALSVKLGWWSPSKRMNQHTTNQSHTLVGNNDYDG